MVRLGVIFDDRLSFRDIVECATSAESVGIESLWVIEALNTEAFSVLSALSAHTERIALGTGVINIFSRTPALIAMSSLTTHKISNGRFILGLGSSNPWVVSRLHGMEFKHSLTRMRECIQIVRELMDGKTLNFRGETLSINNFAPVGERAEIPVYVGALGYKMIELAGEIANGVMLMHASESQVRSAVQKIAEGARRRKRSQSDVDVACILSCCVTDDEAAGKRASKEVIARYTGIGPWGEMFARSGFNREVETIRQAISRNDPQEAAASVTDEMVESLTIFGSAEKCRSKLEMYISAGVRLPIIYPCSSKPDLKASLIKTIEALSR